MTPDRRQALMLAAASLIPATADAQESPPMTDHAHDFDFLVGSWKVRHRRLKDRLVGSTDWQAFDGTCVMSPLLEGRGNVDDNWLDLPAGAYRAVGLRSYDPKTRTWAIWWLDHRVPHALDVPVKGRFQNGVGTFLAEDRHDGAPVIVRFQWSAITANTAEWRQAFSPDGGKTWETNWEMWFTRTA